MKPNFDVRLLPLISTWNEIKKIFLLQIVKLKNKEYPAVNMHTFIIIYNYSLGNGPPTFLYSNDL